MQPITDSEIEQWVLRELQLNSQITSKELCVCCDGGVATLSGTVTDEKQKHAADHAAARARGVRSVIDNIRVTKLSLMTSAATSWSGAPQARFLPVSVHH